MHEVIKLNIPVVHWA